jgi:hypothetical protein
MSHAALTGNLFPQIFRGCAPTACSVLPGTPWCFAVSSSAELFARTLHELGPRREGPLIKVNCAALPAASYSSTLRSNMTRLGIKRPPIRR